MWHSSSSSSKERGNTVGKKIEWYYDPPPKTLIFSLVTSKQISQSPTYVFTIRPLSMNLWLSLMTATTNKIEQISLIHNSWVFTGSSSMVQHWILWSYLLYGQWNLAAESTCHKYLVSLRVLQAWPRSGLKDREKGKEGTPCFKQTLETLRQQKL